MVVSASPVSRVVVSRIVERVGLRSVAVGIKEAVETLHKRRPGLVILDGGADLTVIGAELARCRDDHDGMPLVIHLTLQNATSQGLEGGEIVDASVAKPVMPDSLQPVIVRLLEGRAA